MSRLISSQRMDKKPDCRICGAGSTISVNWQYADQAVFAEPKPLRYGTLYRCKACGQPWYLHGEPAFMSFVPRERLPLIQRWNEQPILLPPEHLSELQRIGRTPPDQYGNGRQFHETPCAVTTLQGEPIEIAVVSMQRHAPFERWRDYRLASEIAQIRPSPYALRLSVRVASSQADEVAMGFAPTFVELPDSEVMALNGTQHFFVQEGCDATDIFLYRRPLKQPGKGKKYPPVYSGTNGIVYFVADDTQISSM